jgi:hypothetical protein
MNIFKSLKSLGLAALLSTSLAISKPANAEEMPFFEKCDTCGHVSVSDNWTFGGQKISWSPNELGSWTYSQNPILNNGEVEGLELRVTGPESGNSHGAQSWVISQKDFNDGNDWQINFSWQAERRDRIHNRYQIQITDGFIEPNGLYWTSKDIPGTNNFISDDIFGKMINHSKWELYFHEQYYTDLNTWPNPIANWSFDINKEGLAKLYDQPNSSGNVISQNQLDKNYPWHFRFMVTDATSSGFPAGDISMNLYSFDATASPVPEPSALLLSGIAGAGLGAYSLARRKIKVS